MSARDQILNRLKKGTFVSTESLGTKGDENSIVKTSALALDTLLEKNLIAANAEVRRCKNDQKIDQLSAWLTELAVKNCWVSETTKTGQQLRLDSSANVNWLDPKDPMGAERSQVFNDIEVGITESDSAIAETGTIVVVPGQDEPRTMSLVPPIHLVIVDLKNIDYRFEDWIQSHPNTADSTNVVLVTGPSKTADIQQTLAFGAHGPKRLLVLLLED